ncbi:uncharacterized protein LOC114531459 [Dendronephthya gigantea]|uniref:uncharacterized protein LOC114531459 n=1 Tax=Dendronephthya gigantea TaxID=151771 RepID=UPI00106B5DF9|nr:uncharacterized protein LOC114531459 [Dendronephthya gigantea]
MAADIIEMLGWSVLLKLSIIAPWDCTTVDVILNVSALTMVLHADVRKVLPAGTTFPAMTKMNVQQETTVIRMPFARTLMGLIDAHVMLDLLEMEPFAKTKMNVLSQDTTVLQGQFAPILKDPIYAVEHKILEMV